MNNISDIHTHAMHIHMYRLHVYTAGCSYLSMGGTPWQWICGWSLCTMYDGYPCTLQPHRTCSKDRNDNHGNRSRVGGGTWIALATPIPTLILSIGLSNVLRELDWE